MIQDRKEPTERLTIRDEKEVILIKKAIKLLLDTSESKLSLSQQMSAIEVYKKTQRALSNGKDNYLHRRLS